MRRWWRAVSSGIVKLKDELVLILVPDTLLAMASVVANTGLDS